MTARKRVKSLQKSRDGGKQPGPAVPVRHRETRTTGNPLRVVLVFALIIIGIAGTAVWHGRRQARDQRLAQLALEQRQEAGSQSVRRITQTCRVILSLAESVEPWQQRVERGAAGIPANNQSVDAPATRVHELAARFMQAAVSVRENGAVAADLLAIVERELMALRREVRPVQAAQRAANLDAHEATAETLLSVTRETVEQLGDLADEIDQLREIHDRIEEERDRQETAARRAREQAELERHEQALVATYRKQTDALIAENRYEDALDTMESLLDQFKTEQAREQHRITIDQCRELAQLKTFLIKSLVDQPMAWGWTQTAPARDILGGNRDVLQVRGAAVAWPDVGRGQMARIIDHVLGDPRTPAALVSRFGIGAAIFFHKAEQPEQARGYVERAIAVQPSLVAQAGRLMPAD